MISTTTIRMTTVAAGAGLLLTGAAAFAQGGWTPPDDTITGVEGSRDSGFHVSYYDGPDAYLPTLSEAVAECGEYQHRTRRIRCTVRVRTWYRDLGDTKRAIRYARLDRP